MIGFTLIELMVTVVIAAILLTVAVPTFRDVIQNNRLATQANDLVTAFNLARSEAITRAIPVSVCKSTDGLACTASGRWDQGWIVFVDPNSSRTVDAGDAILRVHGALPTGFTASGPTNSPQNQGVTYNASGATPGFNQTITLCDPEGDLRRARGVIVSVGGSREDGGG